MTRKPLLIGLGAVLVLGVSAAQAQNADKPSQKFIKNAIAGDIAEVNLGQLAADKGSSDGIKQFGQKLVADHGAHKTKAEAVAQQIGVKPPTGSPISAKAEYLKLKVLSGRSFDKEFARYMVKDHQADIKDYQKQAARSGAAADLAKETLPTLQEHLKMAQSLRNGGTTGSGSTQK
jgi:putative membrane protein